MNPIMIYIKCNMLAHNTALADDGRTIEPH